MLSNGILTNLGQFMREVGTILKVSIIAWECSLQGWSVATETSRICIKGTIKLISFTAMVF